MSDGGASGSVSRGAGDAATADGAPPARPLTPDEWRAAKAVVQAALELPLAERAAFVAEACGDNRALRAEVESLLAVDDDEPDAFLAAPAARRALLDDLAADASAHAADPAGATLRHDANPDATPGTAADDAELAAVRAALADRYAVAERVGRGGMATVYRARDLRHGRDVALKVLHPQLAAALGPARGSERFLREIALTAALQHPHVVPLFDSGSDGGRLWYAMPFVEGHTLRARLAREGALPVDEAVRLAREIAEALAHAHAHGVVHRDVKPENVLLLPGERPHALVADFGVAFAVEHAAGARLTRTGLAVGTPRYMAPEQARGERDVDARADVYALGAVLYEMLAGEPPFAAPSVQLVVQRVLGEPAPPLAARRAGVPPHVAAAVATALAKRPDERFPDVAAFADAIAAPLPAPFGDPPGAPLGGPLGAGDTGRGGDGPAARRRGRRTTLAVTGGALAVGALLGWQGARWGAAAGDPTAAAFDALARAERADAAADRPRELLADAGTLGDDVPAITPDGRTLVLTHTDADGARLWARGIDDLVPRALEGTAGAAHPVLAADGSAVAFLRDGALHRVPLAGGPPTRVAALPAGLAFGGGTWGADGTILLADRRTGALWRVAADGGALARVALPGLPDGVRDPHLLPDGRAALVTLVDCCADRMGVVDLATGAVRELGRGLAPRVVDRQLVFATRDGDVQRQAFDARALAPSGAPAVLARRVAVLDGRPAFDVAAAGTLVHRAAVRLERPAREALALTIRDRTGRIVRRVPGAIPWTPRFAPDGRALAFGAFPAGGESSELWETDLRSGATRQLTGESADANDPQWRPDGRALAYSVGGDGGKRVAVRDGADGGTRPLAAVGGTAFPTDWLPDGRGVVVTAERAGNRDVLLLPADGGPPRPLVATPAREGAARVSPDGRWLAWQSDASGRDEVYVGDAAAPGRGARVSTDGGVHPVWAPDGRTLYYWAEDRLVAARLTTGARTPAVAGRATLFRAAYPSDALLAMYDVSPDGRWVALSAGPGEAERVVVVPGVVGGR